MDHFKEYVYLRHPERYENLQIGDISQQLSLKKDLKCQSFQYFIDNIAPDLLERFPVIENTDFAFGTVRNIKSFSKMS
jgi:polypeptide N-acetylgalactosaminyltransferase